LIVDHLKERSLLAKTVKVGNVEEALQKEKGLKSALVLSGGGGGGIEGGEDVIVVNLTRGGKEGEGKELQGALEKGAREKKLVVVRVEGNVEGEVVERWLRIMLSPLYKL
jgi:hypothetical protein